jgi:hypothetical protein
MERMEICIRNNGFATCFLLAFGLWRQSAYAAGHQISLFQ